MNKIIPILVIILIMGVAGATYFYETNNGINEFVTRDTVDEPVQIIEESPEIETIEITEFNQRINKQKNTVPTDKSDNILTQKQIKENYEKIFEQLFSEYNSTIDVSGPYQMDNGTIYYDVIIITDFDESTSMMHFEADAKTLPEDMGGQNIKIKGALSAAYSGLDKNNDVQPKLSVKDIEQIAREDIQEYYYRHIPLSENNEYNIRLYITQLTKQPVYMVNYGPELVNLIYDANTGELMYSDVFGYGYEGLYESLGYAECIRLGHTELTKYCEQNNLPELDFETLDSYNNSEGQLINRFKITHDNTQCGIMEINTVTQEVTINIDNTALNNTNDDTVVIEENEVSQENTENESSDTPEETEE